MLCSNPYVRVDTTVMPISYLKRKQITQDYKYAYPCGKCLNCRINQSRTWKNRILLEAKSVKYSYFLTLTYNDEHLPYNKNNNAILRKTDLQKFLKRLRRRHDPHRLRYFAVGEYGDINWRPHYHIAIFTPAPITQHDIDRTWADSDGDPIGYTYLGDIANGSAAYLSGYLKKKALQEYFANLGDRPPEFSTQSKQDGGIGIGVINRVAERMIDNGYVATGIIDELNCGRHKMSIGRYLTRKLAEKLGVNDKKFVEKFYNWLNEMDEAYDMSSIEYINNMIADYKGSRDAQVNKSKIKQAKRSL